MTKAAKMWMMNGTLAVLLAGLGAYYFRTPTPSAHAAGGGWETNGMMAITSSGPAERLVLIDTKKQNICVYKTVGQGQFRLVGARSYQYDVELEDTTGTPIEKGDGAKYHEVLQYYNTQKKK